MRHISTRLHRQTSQSESGSPSCKSNHIWTLPEHSLFELWILIGSTRVYFWLWIKIFPIPYFPFTHGCWTVWGLCESDAKSKKIISENYFHSCCQRNISNISQVATPWQRTAFHPSSKRVCRTSVLGMLPWMEFASLTFESLIRIRFWAFCELESRAKRNESHASC